MDIYTYIHGRTHELFENLLISHSLLEHAKAKTPGIQPILNHFYVTSEMLGQSGANNGTKPQKSSLSFYKKGMSHFDATKTRRN